MTGERNARPMTIGELSRRTHVSVKALRQYTDWGLIHIAGRSRANYRLYPAVAEQCVQWIGDLRGLGLTLAEIRELAASAACDDPAFAALLAARLRAARDRIDAKITDLESTRHRIDAFEAAHQHDLTAGGADTGWWSDDPDYQQATA